MLRPEKGVFRAIALVVMGCALNGMPEVAAMAEADTVRGTKTIESRTITVHIDHPFGKTYQFLVNPTNWSQWAFGLGKNIRRSKGGWIADSDEGIVSIRFTPRNSFGVLDHTVIRSSGQRVYVPMRLIVNDRGCELLFTLFREPKMSDAQFASDAGFVQRDLDGLKKLLEK
jgi:hypothetical protein